MPSTGLGSVDGDGRTDLPTASIFKALTSGGAVLNFPDSVSSFEMGKQYQYLSHGVVTTIQWVMMCKIQGAWNHAGTE